MITASRLLAAALTTLIRLAIIAITVFVVAYVLIASDRVNKTFMALAGAAILVAFGVVSSDDVFYSRETGIDWDVIFLLLGMMIIVSVLRQTGVFEYIAIWAAKRAKGSPLRIMILLVLVTALASALLDNVTTVLLVAPVTLLVAGDIGSDAVVLAAGAASPLLTRTMGIRIPVYPAKGYTLTAAIKDPDRAPQVGGIDERSLVAWSRFGTDIRMSATAEFVGYDRSSTPADYAGILAAGEQLFPGAIDWDSARYRTGLRPMTPDGPPLIGLGRHDNLYYNTGHGHVGWTMACGSARMLADLIDGRRPDIDPTPYAPVNSRRHRI